MTLTSVISTSSFTDPIVFGTSVSGTNIFAIMIVPGAVMMTAVSRCLASIAEQDVGGHDAAGDVRHARGHDRHQLGLVISGRYGRIVSGASVCPMKMLAATLSDSAPLAFITRCITHGEEPHDDLHDAEVVEDREQRGDEDDRRQHLEREDDARTARRPARARPSSPAPQTRAVAERAEDERRADAGEAEQLVDAAPSVANTRWPTVVLSTMQREHDLQAEPPGDGRAS